MATLTLQPKLVETALGLKLRDAKSLAKEAASEMRGRSSATTTQLIIE